MAAGLLLHSDSLLLHNDSLLLHNNSRDSPRAGAARSCPPSAPSRPARCGHVWVTMSRLGDAGGAVWLPQQLAAQPCLLHSCAAVSAAPTPPPAPTPHLCCGVTVSSTALFTLQPKYTRVQPAPIQCCSPPVLRRDGEQDLGGRHDVADLGAAGLLALDHHLVQVVCESMGELGGKGGWSVRRGQGGGGWGWMLQAALEKTGHAPSRLPHLARANSSQWQVAMMMDGGQHPTNQV